MRRSSCKQSKFTFIQISDTHICSGNSLFHGSQPLVNLKKVVEDIKENYWEHCFIVHTGDVAQHGKTSEYLSFKKVIDELQSPIYYIRGNHDSNAKLFKESLLSEGSEYKPFHWEAKVGSWHFIGLDAETEVLNSNAMKVSRDQLKWLADTITKSNANFIMLFLHCHIIPVGMPWLDKFLMSNANKLIDILSRGNTVQFIAHGHLHQSVFAVKDNLRCFGAPAVSVQLKPLAQKLEFDNTACAYRVFTVDNRGNLATHIRRLSIPPRNEDCIWLWNFCDRPRQH